MKPDHLGRVIVVGSINADRVVQVTQLPVAGQTVLGGEIAHLHGGKGANQAVAAAMAGAEVILVAAVGEDQAGAEELSVLRAAGVNCGAVRRLAGEATGMAMITVDAHGENQIVVIPGANLQLTPAQIDASLASLAVTQRDVILVCNELSPDAVSGAILAAASLGAQVIFNPAPARALPDGPARFSVITPNRSELLALTASDDIAPAAQGLADKTRASVVVTAGAAGAVIASPGGTTVIRIPAPQCEPVDTVGAGDVFNGVLAARLAAGQELPQAVKDGVERASESTLWRGARSPALNEQPEA